MLINVNPAYQPTSRTTFNMLQTKKRFLYVWYSGPIIFQLNTSYFLQADIVCRQLGYPGAISHYSGSYFGQVPDKHSYSSVSCFGSETIMDECIHSNYPASCGSSDGAGVHCSSYPTTTTTTTRPSTTRTSHSCKWNIFYLNLLSLT